jgi:hypothetical protein
MYGSTLSLTSALDGVVINATPRPLYPPGKTRYTLYRRLGEPQGRSGQAREISPRPGFDPPARPARSQSLYRLNYPHPYIYIYLYIYDLWYDKVSEM